MNHNHSENQCKDMNQVAYENQDGNISQYRVAPQKILRVSLIMKPNVRLRVTRSLKPILELRTIVTMKTNENI